MLKNLFSAPVFQDDDDKTRSAYFINIIVLTNIPILFLFILVRTVTGSGLFNIPNLILASISTVLIIAWVLMKAGYVRLAGYLHVSTIWVASTLLALNGSGVRGTAFTSYFVVMLMAGLLLGWQPAIFYTILSILMGFGLALAENAGLITYTPDPSINIAIESTVLFLFGGVFLYLIINTLQRAVYTAKAGVDDLRASNQELSALRDDLEIRVEKRTRELEQQNLSADRRSRQFEGIVRVSRAIASAKNLQEILPQITQVISEQFGFYHVGIFFNDSVNQYAILSAANSEGGQRMLNRGHQLKIGEQGIVGYVTASGNPRIALDVGSDIVYFNNPDLPLTHSEMALPLKSGSTVIGALDIQSVEQNAFTQQDVEVLEALAEQVSLAIQNTRLLEQTNKLLAEAETIQKQYQRDTWRRLSREKKLTGYKYSITGAHPLDDQEESTGNHSKREVAVPISLRGESIGTLIVQIPANERLNSDQMDLIRAVAERVALSAENARLFEETNRRAEREQVISDISAKISTSVRTENILKTTAQELNQILGGAEVLIKLGMDRNL